MNKKTVANASATKPVTAVSAHIIVPWKIWARAGLDVLSCLAEIPSWLRLSHEIHHRNQISNDFVGVNIATSSDPGCDDKVMVYLQDLAIRHVRMDYSYCSQQGDAQRLLNRVLAEGLDVMLDLFPPKEEAAALRDDVQAQQRWREFLQQVFSEYAGQVSIFEIGSTPNRGKWSGFDGISYLHAWQIATDVAQQFEVTLAGPNISDFEPLYNFAYLKAMKRVDSVPVVHSDNLFVERVVQPEAYDHRVAGNWATRKLNLNLIKKARIIAEIGHQEGCEKTFCTYKCWTRKRLSRWSLDPEQKNADYLVRYLIIAAASGALDRVYWGPLICNRDGLVDCGDGGYPHVDNVSFYKEVRGEVANFTLTKAYVAFKYISALLRHVVCVQGVSADNGINHFIFETEQGGEAHVVWCLDRSALALSDIYSKAQLDSASFKTAEGVAPQQLPMMATEQPLIIEWSQLQSGRPSSDDIRTLDDVLGRTVVYHAHPGLQSVAVNTPQWLGVVAVADGQEAEATVATYMPAAMLAAQELAVLRDTRNRLWNIQLNEQAEEIQTVKLNRAKGIKKFTYRFMPSKGKRHWNNATEMLRRGINTPQPLAFFERHKNAGIEDNYYVCRFVPNAFSARNVFQAFNQGESVYKGMTKEAFFEAIAAFIATMHASNIVHRDLSSGNLMMTMDERGLTFYAIDIGRASIDKTKTITDMQRGIDLKRICYKLNWADRALFMAAYHRCIGKEVKFWQAMLWSYDAKQGFKKGLKAKLKGKKRS
ncbi:lipopolysaccharide kinase InaA family protein [Dasania marina]|uniref:lipopolysaccharide kinase InaA family protein n=1 Tax=Dasania marina TaxID=471499 RepID=UPI0030D818DD